MITPQSPPLSRWERTVAARPLNAAIRREKRTERRTHEEMNALLSTEDNYREIARATGTDRVIVAPPSKRAGQPYDTLAYSIRVPQPSDIFDAKLNPGGDRVKFDDVIISNTDYLGQEAHKREVDERQAAARRDNAVAQAMK